MALLDLVTNLCDKLNLARPSVVIGSTDQNIRSLLAHANDAGKELATDYQWADLEGEYTFTLASGQASYALPPDFDRHIPQTHWDRDRHWELIGPITPQEWQFRKSGTVASAPRRRFRVKTRTASQFFIDPTPASADSGLTIAFEFVSASWVSPMAWAASTVFAANSYCSYNGNYYKTAAGGTTGSTAPTHTTGTVSDGGVSWAYNTDLFDHFVADTDTSIIPQAVLEIGTAWRFLHSKGLPTWVTLKDRAEDMAARWSSKKRGAAIIDMTNVVYGERFIGPWSVPDTGFGA